jgi:type II secretory pathway pseudopilin PulG
MNQPPPIPSTTPQPQKTSGLAISSLVFGIISLLGGVILIIPFLLAVVFGHIAYARCGRDPSTGGKGIAIAGLATGYASLILIPIIGLLAAMAIPAFQKVREHSLEKAMANDARQIGTAAQQVMLDNPGKPVVFTIDPATGTVTGSLSVFVPAITAGTTAVDNLIESETDGFSLRNPHVRKGVPIEFDAEGRPVSVRLSQP